MGFRYLAAIVATAFISADAKPAAPAHLISQPVNVCVAYGSMPEDALQQVEAAESVAQEIFRRAGMALRWQNHQRCPAGHWLIVVTLPASVDKAEHPHAFGYAEYEVSQIVVFYSRVQHIVNGQASYLTIVLGHVLAHEITHVLQGTRTHMATGLMKKDWNLFDFHQMLAIPLSFTPADLELIRDGPWGSR